jgi:hypothetical protein
MGKEKKHGTYRIGDVEVHVSEISPLTDGT